MALLINLYRNSGEDTFPCSCLQALPGTDHTMTNMMAKVKARGHVDRNSGVVASAHKERETRSVSLCCRARGMRKECRRTAFALAQEEKFDDLLLLPQHPFSLDVFVYFVAYSSSFCFVRESVDLLFRCFVRRRCKRGIEWVGRFADGHGWGSSKVVMVVVAV